jgi:hypothetical protein
MATRAKSIRVRGNAPRYSEASQNLSVPGDVAVVLRGIPRSILIACPDGCGETITLNVDRGAGPAWRFYQVADRLTIYPSVWRESGCRSHFIVWNSQILWCDNDYFTPWDDKNLISIVLKTLPLPSEPFRHYEDVAEELDANPWEVLWACKAIQREGNAESIERETKFRTRRKEQVPGNRIDVMA